MGFCGCDNAGLQSRIEDGGLRHSFSLGSILRAGLAALEDG
jgi:hypothetical protein